VRTHWTLLLQCSTEVPHGLHATHGTVASTSTVLGQSPVVLAAAVVQSYSFHSTSAGSS
jgi:hypothetical protein